MEKSIHEVSERSVWWKLEAFGEGDWGELVDIAVDIAWEKLKDGRSPDTEIEYTRTNRYFIARARLVSADGFMKLFTDGQKR